MTVQLSLRHWPGMRLTWVDRAAVVHSGSEPSASAKAVVDAASAPTELCVVVSTHTVRLVPPMIEELAGLLAGRLPRGCVRVRLVAWDAACAYNERPAPAYLLASRLGIEVLAPAGPLLGVPGGSLFAPPGRGNHRRGGWWRFLPGTVPVRVGWRFPAPAWETDVNLIGELPADLVLDQVPAGLWLHRPGNRSVTDLVFSVPIDPAAPALILSHPSEEPLRPAEMAAGLEAVSPRALERMVLTPYGQRPLVDGRIGEVAAGVLGHAVRARTGLPLCAAAGQHAVVAIDESGLPRWRPFARELRYGPRGATPGAVDWSNPAPGVLTVPAGAGTFALDFGWVAEVIEAGLWVRPMDSVPSADWVRTLPLDAEQCTVVIGSPDANEPSPPSQLIASLLKQLPADARARARLAVPRGAAPQIHRLASSLCAQLPSAPDVAVVGPTERKPASSQRLPELDPLSTSSTGSRRAAAPVDLASTAERLIRQVWAHDPDTSSGSGRSERSERAAPVPTYDRPATERSLPGERDGQPTRSTPREWSTSEHAPVSDRPRHSMPPAAAPAASAAPVPPEPTRGAPAQPARGERPVPPVPPIPPLQPAPRHAMPAPAAAMPAPAAHAVPSQATHSHSVPSYSRSPHAVPPPHGAPAPRSARPSHAGSGPATPYVGPAHAPEPQRPAAPDRPAPGKHFPPADQSSAQRPAPADRAMPARPVSSAATRQAPVSPAPVSHGPGGAEQSPRREVRSHRNGAGKPVRVQREDDRVTTKELNRLLGFFDEIRRARAWDEDPDEAMDSTAMHAAVPPATHARR